MHSFLPSLLISLIVVMAATTVHHAAGQEVTSSVLLAQAERALDEEQFEDAVRLATRILASEPDHSRARLARAHAWLFTDPANPDDAAADIAHVLDREPDNPRAHELDLWHDYRYGSSFLLPFRTSDRLRRARQIIESDSTRRLAHLVAGLIRYSDFRDTHEAVRFRSFTRPGDATGVDDAVTDAAAYLFDTEIDTAGDEHGLSFRDPSVTGIRMDYTPLTEAANRYAREAADRLLAASGPDRPGVTAHRYLAEVFVRLKEYDRGAEAAFDLIRSRPDLAEGWMYRGMFRAHSGDWEGADEDFEAAFDRSAPSVRLAMTSPELFTPDAGTEDGSSVRRAYWMKNDPLWSTGTNEAMIEHVARMVEADLRFGNSSGSVDGWSTDPGTVFVRYGAPLATARYNSLTEGYMLLHYGERRFMFMKPGRRGGYTFYSPSAADFGGSRSNIRQWESDQEIASREAFRKEPRSSSVLSGRELQMEVVATRFGGDSPAMVVAWCMPGPVDEVQLLELRPGSDRPERISDDHRPLSVADGPRAGTDGCATYVTEAPAARETARYSLEVRSGDHFGVVRFDAGPGEAAQTRHGMTISDLMPAHLVEDTPDTPDAADAPGASSALRRPGHAIYPAGTTTLEAGTDLYLYFELYGSGASAARPATLRIQAALVPDTDRGDGRLERLLGGIFADADRAPVSVDFSESVSTDVVHRYLILRTDGLDPGHYTVAIRVTDPETDHTTQSTRMIELTEQVED